MKISEISNYRGKIKILKIFVIEIAILQMCLKFRVFYLVSLNVTFGILQFR